MLTQPDGSKLADAPLSEIGQENSQLEKAIQETFDNMRKLRDRLQSVIRAYPTAPQADKNPEEAMTDLGANLRRHRRAVEGINDTATEILRNLAL